MKKKYILGIASIAIAAVFFMQIGSKITNTSDETLKKQIEWVDASVKSRIAEGNLPLAEALRLNKVKQDAQAELKKREEAAEEAKKTEETEKEEADAKEASGIEEGSGNKDAADQPPSTLD